MACVLGSSGDAVHSGCSCDAGHSGSISLGLAFSRGIKLAEQWDARAPELTSASGATTSAPYYSGPPAQCSSERGTPKSGC